MRSLLLAVLFIFTSNALADELIGTWTIKSQSPRGTQESELVVRKDGDGLAGTLNGRRSREIAEIKRSGDTFSFAIEFDTPRGSFRLAYKGTIDAHTLSGSVETPRGARPFTGVRKVTTDT